MIVIFEIVRKRYLILVLISILLILVFTNNLDKITGDVSSESWCDIQPCYEINLFSQTVTISQPSSSVFVYLLGIIASSIGISFLRTEQKFSQWWGTALLFWGLGAIFAGTSYQLLGYEIKCGNEICNWTSWWEVYYMILTVSSVSSMLMAHSLKDKNRVFIRNLAYVIAIAYIIIVLIGSIIPFRFLISFEFMILVIAPVILYMFIGNVSRCREHHLQLDKNMIMIWIYLGLIMVAYYAYYLLGITELLWNNGLWFSENDVLHILLILWMVYVRKIITRNHEIEFT